MEVVKSPRAVDLVIHARYVVPVEPAGVLERHALVVDGGRIVALAPSAGVDAAYRARETVELASHVLMPGLVNTHAHSAMTLLRGVADDLPLMEWLQGHIWPLEAQLIGPEFVADGVELAIAEMLRGGTTCCNENYFFPDVQAATYKRHGFRARVGLPIIDFPSAWARSDDEYFDRATEVHDQWRTDPLVATAFAPHAPYTVSDGSFERIRMLSDQLDLPVHCHVHETAHEVAESQQKFGQRPLARMDRLGLVNDRLIAVHMTQLTDAEIALCAERGVSVAHCAESNLKLASGFCPVAKLHRAGVNVAVGTDGAASNNDLDMFGEMRSAALLAKGVAGDASAFDAAAALRAATLGGAKALGFDHLVGSIEPGKQADLVCVDLGQIETQPLHHVISQLAYACGRQHVSDVWIAGEAKLREQVLVDMDPAALVANARQWRQRIAVLKGA